MAATLIVLLILLCAAMLYVTFGRVLDGPDYKTLHKRAHPGRFEELPPSFYDETCKTWECEITDTSGYYCTEGGSNV